MLLAECACHTPILNIFVTNVANRFSLAYAQQIAGNGDFDHISNNFLYIIFIYTAIRSGDCRGQSEPQTKTDCQ